MSNIEKQPYLRVYMDYLSMDIITANNNDNYYLYLYCT